MQIYPLSQVQICSVVKIDARKNPEGRTYYPQTLPHYELIYFLSGRGNVHFCGKDDIDAPGKIRFMPRGIHGDRYCVDSLECGECIDIYFDTDEPLPKEMLCREYGERTNIKRLFIQMEKCWHRREIGYRSQCLSMFYSILAEMEIADQTYVPSKYRQILAPALEYIHTHYSKPAFDFARLPLLCGIGDTYFRKLFLRVYGLLPSEYIRNLRLEYACELLFTEQFSVTQVSDMCGFQDISYFSKVFKKAFGIVPSEYRMKNAHD